MGERLKKIERQRESREGREGEDGVGHYNRATYGHSLFFKLACNAIKSRYDSQTEWPDFKQQVRDNTAGVSCQTTTDASREM